MRHRFPIIALVCLVAGFVLWRWPVARPEAAKPSVPPSAAQRPLPAATPSIAAAAAPRDGLDEAGAPPSRAAVLATLTYARDWNEVQPAGLAEFRDWTTQYLAAGSAAERAALEPAGLALARLRRPAMRALMERDPQRALALTVPAAVRPALPAAIVAELETRFSARADFSVLVVDYPAEELARRLAQRLGTESYHYAIELGGREYPAFVYGRRATQTTKHGAPVHGVMLEGAVALHESALRVIEPGETVPAESAIGPWQAEYAGRVLAFASPADLLAADARQAAAERALGPTILPLTNVADTNPESPGVDEIPLAAAPPTAWTVGSKNVLVIRVDFADLPGSPARGSTIYTQAFVQNLTDTQVAPYYLQSSYGQTSITTTVTSQVYRMPQTAVSYATGNANTQLHTDARTAASTSYNVDSFDRVVVLFSNLGSISGSQITYGGLAQVGGRNVWVNGAYDFRIMAHELGHTYGLRHANLWQVGDGNPVSASGTSTEYGDDYDTMGANFANSRSTDFNPWFKNLLGWAADSQVQNVTASGTYRLNRFDNSTGTGTLALKFTRDSTRNYWIGVRRNFTSNTFLSHGAYVMWGFNSNQQSNLLDLNTPGSSVVDSALAVGATLVDPVGNLSIRTVSEGGTAPNEFLDVQVTVGLNGIPVIDQPPQSQGFTVGSTVSLSVIASGNATLAYQWRKNGADIAGATSALYSIANAQAGDAGTYSVRVSNSIGSVLSNGAVVTLNAMPEITTQPLAYFASVGKTVTLTVGATGSPAPTYQWRKGVTDIPGATGPSLTFPSVQLSDGDNYSVFVSNSLGTILSDTTVVAVQSATNPPTNDNFENAWPLFPLRPGVALGSNVGASAQSGEPLLFNSNGTATSVWYKWLCLVNGVAQVDTIGSNFDTVLAVYTGSAVGALTKIVEDDQSGGLNTSKVLFPVTSGTTYYFAVGDWSSSRLGGNVVLHYTGFATPLLGSQPSNQVATLGGSATFSVVAGGTGVNFQWFRNGVPIPGANAATLTLHNLTLNDAGSYHVVLTNPAGSVTSNTATLSGSNAAPVISAGPANLAATAGQSPSLSVAASGAGSLTYQWRRNGLPIPGATGATLSFPNIGRVDADAYDVIVGSGLSVAISAPARVTVAPASYPGLVAPDPAWELRPEAPLGIFVHAIAPLADGRAYIAGSFVSIDGVRRSGLARLNADGSVDTTFLPPEIDHTIRAIAVQPDGKIVIGGDFVRVNGLLRNRIARLNADGTVDASFNAGAGAGSTVLALALQADGKILVGGNFLGYAGSLRDRLARLNADGSLDTTLLNRGFTAPVTAIVVQSDGRMVVGGSFGGLASQGYIDNNGAIVTRAGLARLNTDGTVDATYNASTNGPVNALALQGDGRLVVGGSFTLLNNASSIPNLARLNSNGTVDASFLTTGGLGFNGAVGALTLDASGRILAGGSFTTFAGATATRFARLNATGSRDFSLQTGGFNSSVTSTAVLPNGQILVGGGFSAYINTSNVLTTRVRLARLNGDGTLHAASNFSLRAAGTVNAIVPLAGDKMVIAGFFNTLRGAAVPNSLAQINPDGSVESAFNLGGAGANSNVLAAVAQPDGKIIIGGAFTTYNGTTVNGIARVKDDGTLDSTFSAGTGIFAGFEAVLSASLLPGGRVVIGGAFSSVNGVIRSGIAVLGPTGAVDLTFDPGAGVNGIVYASAVQPDGKILIGGAFTSYNGVSVGRVARLNPNGSLDTSFNPGGAGASLDVLAVALQPDGKIVIGGAFSTYNGTSRNGVARLTSSGALDTDFTPPFVNNVMALMVQEDGKVVLRGSFPAVNATTGTAFIARLNANGERDTSFGAGGFAIANLAPSQLIMGDAGQLFMQSTGATGLSASIAATAPVITTPPVAQTTSVGGTVTLSVVASSSLPATYQWFRNGGLIAGATGPTLLLTNAQAAGTGDYTVTITNELGSTTSAPAYVAVGPTRGINLASVLTNNFGGAITLSGVFTIEASASKQMLVRVVGPTLGALGITGVLADPQVTIVNATTEAVVATNDDWGAAANAAQVPTATAQVGAFPLQAGSKDAAVLATFAPGTYRVRVTGAGSTTGQMLLEIYDADASPRLVYAAVRAEVGGALTKGFDVAKPPAGRSYLIRALGPSLGIPGAIADPQLSLYAGTTLVASNDNWNGDLTVASLAASVGALPLAPGSQDAALVFVPTAAGSFSAQVSAVGGTTGVVLLEIFEADSQRAATVPLALVSSPENVVVFAGQPATFGVVTVGKPSAVFQWSKGATAIPGATGSGFVIPRAQVADAGSYTVVAGNGSGTSVTATATLTVNPANNATHTVVGRGYTAGGTVTITNTIHHIGSPSLAWSVTIPSGWSYASDAGSVGNTRPAPNATGTLSWTWTTVPASPVTFTYTLNVPAGESAPRTLAATVTANASNFAAAPNPLPVMLAPPNHSADINGDNLISLLELTRVIELYNTRNGTTRTGCYRVEAAGEDGFAPEPSRANTATVVLTAYHAADSNRDGKLGLLELTRVIELYNHRSGTTRTGQYHTQDGTEDGFAPGP
jgi:uncharacterized delta-60 repeat protein/M6 family metalloprotease-like protein